MSEPLSKKTHAELHYAPDKCPTHVGASIGSKTPLSKVFGLERRNNCNCDTWDACGCSEEDYNQALDNLDQLSPDVASLENIIINKKMFSSKNFDRELAQEIINQMGKWIKKG